MNDVDRYHSQLEARRAVATRTSSTRYGEAVNRYLGAAGCRSNEPARPAETTDRSAGRRTTGVIVVGVDDTPAGYIAVDHAAIEAGLRGYDLRIVHVQQPGGRRPAARDEGARLLERLLDRVHAYSPTVPVTCRLEAGSAAPALLAGAAPASLVVVGRRHGSIGAAFGLSVGDRVAAGHAGPVLIVRVPGWPPGPEFGSRPIVVGAESPDSPPVRFALEEARVRGCDLVMLRAGQAAVPGSRLDTVDGVRVHHTTVSADPAAALLEASNRAAAIVVGRRRSAVIPGASLGSVSRALVQHAHCPVFLAG
jgi:nucleotide-binding universal stress UspA family protein